MFRFSVLPGGSAKGFQGRRRFAMQPRERAARRLNNLLQISLRFPIPFEARPEDRKIPCGSFSFYSRQYFTTFSRIPRMSIVGSKPIKFLIFVVSGTRRGISSKPST